ncbi:LuxR C-terminal-related transcriptional regulator [Chloroflexota bacterium]
MTEQLAAGLEGRLTLLSAPAGFGKTTLLSQVISTIKRPVAWVSLDEGDNEPVRFWSYFITALQTVRAGLGQQALTALETSPMPHVESIVTTLINTAAEIPEDIVIVLDDYQMITNESVHGSVAFFLEYMPPQFHLVLSTRSDPPFTLTLLRGRGQLAELRAADLRFTFEETTAFFNDVMKLQLSDESIATLENRTEGWIASLQMAAISMRGRTDISGFINAFSGTHHYIMDYLAEQVLHRQDEDVQSFLLKTSILDRLTGPLCDAVIGQNDSEEMLDRLEVGNLFLVPLDDERKWFRYHHLFADLLRSRLMEAYPEDMPIALRLRASEWFKGEGLIEEAIHYALEARDFARAADLVEEVAMSTILQSRLSPFRNWLAALPSELLTTRPWLCLGSVVVHLSSGQLDAGEFYLQAVERQLANSATGPTSQTIPDHDLIQSFVMTIRAIIPCGYGDTSSTIDLCQKALDLLPDGEPNVRCMLAFHLAVAHGMRGELTTATHHLAEARTYGEAAGHYYTALTAIACMAEIEAKQGRLLQAAATNEEAIRLAAERGGGEPLPAASLAYINLARIHYRRNHLDAAKGHAIKGAELAEHMGESIVVLASYLTLARIHWALEDTEAMTHALDRARQIATLSTVPMLSTFFEAWLARFELTQGRVPDASRWATSSPVELNLQAVPDFWLEFPYLTLVRVLIAKGQIEDVPETMEHLLQRAMSNGHTETVIEILILQSMALQKQGNSDEALDVLERALALAKPEGYVRCFTDEGDPMGELLSLAASHSIAPDYVSRLLSASAVTPPATDQTHTLQEPLTERELEVLRLAADAMSNPEIAAALVIEETTVKSHMSHILGKLQAKNRLQAVEKARGLGLL